MILLLDMEVKVNLVSILQKCAAWKTTREPPTLPPTAPDVLNSSSKPLPLHTRDNGPFTV